jgi:hypothetical protein
MMTSRPFTIHVPDEALAELRCWRSSVHVGHKRETNEKFLSIGLLVTGPHMEHKT